MTQHTAFAPAFSLSECKELGGAFAAYLDGEPVAAYLAFVLWFRKKRIEIDIGCAPGVG